MNDSEVQGITLDSLVKVRNAQTFEKTCNTLQYAVSKSERSVHMCAQVADVFCVTPGEASANLRTFTEDLKGVTEASTHNLGAMLLHSCVTFSSDILVRHVRRDLAE